MRKFAFIVLLLLAPTAVFAQDDWRNRPYHPPQSRPELTIFGGYRWGGELNREVTGFRNDFDVESSPNFGGTLGIPLGFAGMKFELTLDHQSTHLQLGGDLFNPTDRFSDFDVTYYQAGLQIPFEMPGVTPFVSFSMGAANLDINQPGLTQETRFAASAGIGAKIPFNPHVGLRLELKGYYTSLDDGGDDCHSCYYDYYGNDLYQGETNIGLVITF